MDEMEEYLSDEVYGVLPIKPFSKLLVNVR